MRASDTIFDQRGFNIRASAEKTARKMTHFRVHLADGSKHDVLADKPQDAATYVEKRYPGLKVTRTKVVREQVPA